MSGFHFKDRRALVTGASSGIGKALARQLAAAGCNLIIVARRQEQLNALADELTAKYAVEVTVHAADLTAVDAVEALAGVVADRPISILVNNAGYGVLGSFPKADWGHLANMIDLNVRVVGELTHRLLPGLEEQADGARILNIGSVAGYQGVPHMATYAGTKAFVNHFSEGLAWELRKSNVRVCGLEPGQTASEFFQFSEKEGTFMSRFGLLSAEAVARAGLKQLRSGRSRVVVGFLNKLMVFGLRLFPRPVVGLVVRAMFRDMA